MTATLREVAPASPRSRLDVRVTGGIVRGVDDNGIRPGETSPTPRHPWASCGSGPRSR